MTLHKSMWKAAVLMGIAGVLLFAGGAFAAVGDVVGYRGAKLVCSGLTPVIYDTTWTAWWNANKDNCTVHAQELKEAAVAGTLEAGDSIVTSGNDNAGATFAAALTVASNHGSKSSLSIGASVSVSFTLAVAGQDGKKWTTATTGTSLPATQVDITLTTSVTSVRRDLTAELFRTPVLTPGAHFADRIASTAEVNFRTDSLLYANGVTGTGIGTTRTLYYKQVDGTTGDLTPTSATNIGWSSTKPKLPGTYAVFMTINQGTGYNADTLVIRGGKGSGFPDGVIKLQDDDVGLVLRWETATPGFVRLSQDLSFEFNPTNKSYTIPYPIINDAFYGQIDSVKVIAPDDDITWVKNNQGSTNNGDLPNIGVYTITVANVPASKQFTAVTDTTGTAQIKVTVYGQYKPTTGNGNYWRLENVLIPVEIKPRDLGDGWINATNIDVNVLGTYTYTAAKQNIPITSVQLRYNGTPVSNTAATAYDFASAQDLTDLRITLTSAGASGVYNDKYAGKGYVVLSGDGNFTGYAVGTYNIGKLSVRFSVKDVYDKVYDGTTALDTNSKVTASDGTQTDNKDGSNNPLYVTVEFPNAAGVGNPAAPEAFVNTVDYKITSAVLDNANVGQRTATLTVALDTTGTIGRNYTLSNTTATKTMRVVALDPPVAKHFTITIPADTVKFFTNNRQAISGTLGWKSPLTNGSSTLQLAYRYGTVSAVDYSQDTSIFISGTDNLFTGDTTLAPKAPGTYGVVVRVKNAPASNPNIPNGDYVIGTYTINDAVAPSFAIGQDATAGDLKRLPADGDVRQTNSFLLYVTATSPNNGTLSYKWYQSANSDLSGATEIREDGKSVNKDSVYVMAAYMGQWYYYAVVTNSKPGIQVPISVNSQAVSVNVIDPPTRINGSITVTTPANGWVYTGYAIEPSGDAVTVKQAPAEEGQDSIALAEGTDYVLEYSSNINVGTGASARVVARGIGNYNGSLTTYFAIVPKDVEASDFSGNWELVYTGSKANVNVRTRSPLSGMGAIKVYYSGDTVVPTNADRYDVEVTVAAGTNFKAQTAKMLVNTLNISKRTPGLADVLKADGSAFSIPTGHKEGVTTTFGVGAIKLKGDGYGDIEVLYDGFDIVPTSRGSYNVTAVVEEGDNYESGEIQLGTYTIIGENDAVLESNREVPKAGVTEVVTVAPVKVAAAGFTAGPSPVKAGTAIKFFSAKSVKSGTLYIFDANGNSVAKLSAKSASGEIASWNLKDKKGASVSEGTYVVKGALTGKDGTREKVSFVFSVVK